MPASAQAVRDPPALHDTGASTPDATASVNAEFAAAPVDCFGELLLSDATAQVPRAGVHRGLRGLYRRAVMDSLAPLLSSCLAVGSSVAARPPATRGLQFSTNRVRGWRGSRYLWIAAVRMARLRVFGTASVWSGCLVAGAVATLAWPVVTVSPLACDLPLPYDRLAAGLDAVRAPGG